MDPETYLPDAKLEEKFLGFAGSAFGVDWAAAALESLKQVETLPDVRTLRVFDGLIGAESTIQAEMACPQLSRSW